MTYDARAIANYFLDISDEIERQLSHAALHKILYFTHGWFLAFTGKPLVTSPFEAWKMGPVLNIVYDEFHEIAPFEAVRSRATVFDCVTEATTTAHVLLSSDDKHLIDEIFSLYSPLSTDVLIRMSHKPGAPWDQIWNRHSGIPSAGMKMPDQMIKNYFENTRQHIDLN